MATITNPVIKDVVYCLQAYIFWHDEYLTEHEWTAGKNADKFLHRLHELLPDALELVREFEPRQ